ncbi:hypothetical protein D3C79_925160 [compost metagenome]
MSSPCKVGNMCCGKENSTPIGSIWVTLNSPWVSATRRKLPSSTLRIPTLPVTGERIWV